MEEEQSRKVTEKELAGLLKSMPDNVVLKVTFGEENIFCNVPRHAPLAAPAKKPEQGG